MDGNRQVRPMATTEATYAARSYELMGFIRITKRDGTEILLGDDFDNDAIIETCDICNEPRPFFDLVNVGGRTDHDAIWECGKCHGVSGTRKDG